MAEGGGRVNAEQASIVAGSESVFDFYCEVCKDDDTIVEASGFCVNCEEYLCGPCISAHKRARPSRYHNVLDKAEMPKDEPLTQDRVIKAVTKTCTAHTGETVRFYCQTHDAFGCSTCLTTAQSSRGHRGCSDIKSITEKGETLLDSVEYKEFTESLKAVQQKASDLTSDVKTHVSQTQECCSANVSSIRDLRQQVNCAFDKMEHHFIEQAEQLAKEETGTMDALENKLQGLSESIESIGVEVDNLQSSKRVCQLFIRMKEVAHTVSDLQDRLVKMRKEMCTRTFTFEPNSDLVASLENMDTFGTIRTLHTPPALDEVDNSEDAYSDGDDLVASLENMDTFGTIRTLHTPPALDELNNSGFTFKLSVALEEVDDEFSFSDDDTDFGY